MVDIEIPKNYKIVYNDTEEELKIYETKNYRPNLIGWLYYDLNFLKNRKYVLLNILKINEEYKSRGFGTLLVQKFIEHIKSEMRHVTHIFLYVDAFEKNSHLRLTNEQLYKFYGKAGFEIYTQDFNIPEDNLLQGDGIMILNLRNSKQNLFI